MGVVSGTTRLYAHLGDPIDIVKSPFIYNPWFLQQDIDAAVIPMGVRAGGLARRAPGSRQPEARREELRRVRRGLWTEQQPTGSP
jgi:shikimate 5-dehydrogenase